MEDYPKKKSGSGIIVFILIFVIIGGAAASNFFGPVKGWVNKITEGKPKGNKIVLDEGLDPEQPGSAKPTELTYMVEPGETTDPVEKLKEPEPAEEKKSEVQELYDSLFTKYREKFPDPEVGKEYNVYLKTGNTRGTLKEFTDGKIIIKKPGVTVTYRMDTVSRRSYPKLFPKKAAKILALRELKKILEERNAPKESDLPKPGVDQSEKTIFSDNQYVSPKTFAYDPSPQESPANLKKPLAAFAEWVKFQQRKIGGKIGKKVYAKQQGRNVVLYMHTTNLFDQQSYDVRFTVTEAMWQIWGFKCLDHGAARATSQTHIVLVGSRNRIVGGSSKNDSSNIWVKK